MGCSQPALIGFGAELINVCDRPIQVLAPRYANGKEGWKPLDTHLDVGESVNVLALVCHTDSGFFHPSVLDSAIEKLERCAADDYILEIRSNGNQRSLNWNQLIEVLKRSKLDESGWNIWTIADPSLCP
jgi:hypothetical protein